MKVSLLRCVCVAVALALTGCGDQPESTDAEQPPPDVEPGRAAPIESAGAAGADARDDDYDDAETAESQTFPECPELDQQPASCGQISIKLKGRGSSCQLGPTASDLTRSPRSVRFDCEPLVRGPDGYDYDELGHITLMGETCDQLQRGGPHRVTLVLGCEPGTSER